MQADSIEWDEIKDYLNINEDRDDPIDPPKKPSKQPNDPKQKR